MKSLDPGSPEVKQWRTSMLQLPDRIFFDIIRNYLGPVQTPYNKHDLIHRLEAFLRREDIQDRISLMTTKEEGIIIAALGFLGPIEIVDLTDFLGDSLPSMDMYRSLSALEDRLVIYKSPKGKLCFNPWLEEQVYRGFGNPRILFPSSSTLALNPPIPWANDLTLLAMEKILEPRVPVLKQDRSLNKKTLDTFRHRVPDFLGHQERIEWGIQGLLLLGLVTIQESESREIITVSSRWDRIFDLSPWERINHWWAAIITAADILGKPLTCGKKPGKGVELLTLDDISYFELEEENDLAQILSGFLSHLPEDRCFDKSTLNRILQSFYPIQSQETTPIIQGLIFLEGLVPLTTEGKETSELYQKNPNLKHLSSNPPVKEFPEKQLPSEHIHGTKGIIITPDGLISIQGWVSGTLIHSLLPLFSLKKVDYLISGEICQEGAQQLFRQGTNDQELIDRLTTLSGNPLPQNIASLITHWYRQFSSVKAMRGILLQVDSQRETLLLHDPELSALGIRSLSPGNCFIPTNEITESALSVQLHKAGIPLNDLLPALENTDPGYPDILPIPERAPKAARFFRRIWGDEGQTAPIGHQSAGELRDLEKEAQQLKAELTRHLETLNLHGDTTRELEHRIAMGLIFSTDQLKAGISRPEQTQAGGLDYTAKVRLIETAIQCKDVLEIRLAFLPGLGESELLVEPLQLRGRGNQMDLMAYILPNRQLQEITVSRMQHIRRLKGGLFR